MKFTVSFRVPAQVIYKALTDERELTMFTRTPAKFQESGELLLFEGRIQGEVLELKEPSLIRMKWKMSDWPSYSDVSISIKDLGDDESEVTVEQSNFPERDAAGRTIDPEEVQSGWHNLIFENINNILGYAIVR